MHIFIYIYMHIYNDMVLPSSLSLTLWEKIEKLLPIYAVKTLVLMYHINVGVDFVIL